MHCQIRLMTPADYPEAYHLWTQTEGMSLGEDDNPEGIAFYLERNPGLCFIALADGHLIGTLLCGHDGRRGILRHLAIQKEFRKQGAAVLLVQKCLAALSAQGIKKCNTFVMDDNLAGLQFWEHIGFHRLADDYRTLQITTNAAFPIKTK
jgi:ribosomal protein S18 acetylase RimI-like enzyme